MTAPKVYLARAGRYGEDEDLALEDNLAIIGFHDVPSLDGLADYDAVAKLERVNTNGPEHGILPRIVLDAESGGKSESWNSPSLNLNGSRRCCRGSAET